MDDELYSDGVFLLLAALVRQADKDAAGTCTGCKDADERQAAQLEAQEWIQELRGGYCAAGASRL